MLRIMREKKCKQSLLLQLNKKTQMLNIDSTLSFIIFSIFLIMITSYIQDLITPYESSINYEIMYKDAESLSKTFVTNDLTKEYLDNICLSNYSKVLSTYAYYQIKTIEVPGYDCAINYSKYGIQLMRTGENLTIFFNTNNSIDFEIKVISSEEIIINKTKLDEYDNFSLSRDSDFFVIDFNINNSNLDNDEVMLQIKEDTLLFFNTNYDNKLIYIDGTPFFYECNKKLYYASKKDYVDSFSILNGKNIISEYGVDVYWE